MTAKELTQEELAAAIEAAEKWPAGHWFAYRIGHLL